MRRAVRPQRITGTSGTNKAVVFCVAQCGKTKKQGEVAASLAPTGGAASLIPKVQVRVLQGAVVYTDEWTAYNSLEKRGY
jgi:hypothetical protein